MTGAFTDRTTSVGPGGRSQHSMVFVAASTNSSAVWEWDGATTTWTNRTPSPGSVIPPTPAPNPRGTIYYARLLSFDDARQKMFLFTGPSTWQGTTSNNVFWEWDPVSAGWAFRDSGDLVNIAASGPVAYDSLRRRQVLVALDADSQTCDGNGMCVDGPSCGTGGSGGAGGRGGTAGFGGTGAGGATGRGGASGSDGTVTEGTGSFAGTGVGGTGVGGTTGFGGTTAGGSLGRGGASGSRPPDTGTVGLGHKGCSCDLSETARSTPGLPFLLLAAALWLRRSRRLRAGR